MPKPITKPVFGYVSTSVRLPGDLHDTLVKLAKQENRSLAGQIIYMLRQLAENYLHPLP